MTEQEFRTELILRLSQGVAQGGGVDKAAFVIATDAIIGLADSITNRLYKKEEKEEE